MSILITGMDMPREGQVLVIDSVGQVWVHEWPMRGYIKIDKATAVPVPTPYGDLIERKTAYNSIFNGMVMTGYQSKALDCINEFYVPTIIEAEDD